MVIPPFWAESGQEERKEPADQAATGNAGKISVVYTRKVFKTAELPLPPRSENGAKAIFSIFAPSIPPGRKPRRCGGLEIFLAKFCFLPLFGGLAGWHDRPTLELPSPTAVALQSSIQPNNRCFPCPYREMYPSSFFVATTLPRKLSVTTPVLGAQKGKKKPKNLAKKFHPSRRLFKVFGRVF